MPKPLESILIKPAGPDCNLACEYCFYLEKAEVFHDTERHRMDDATLEVMISQMLHQPVRNISFNWQGGEPTLMGLDFFRKAVELQQQYGRGQQVSNSLQTNGLLLDDQWYQFLKEYRFLVGLSLDGPEHVHDRYRKTVTGAGSYGRVLKSCQAMLKSGVEVNALTVLNNHSVKHLDEIYRHHKALGLSFMQFIPCLETAADEIASFSLSPEAYGEALCQLFDLWTADFHEGFPTTSIRHFDSLFYHYVGMEPPDCTMRKACGVYLVVEHNGDVFPCDFFVDEERKLGNLKFDKLVDLFNSEKQKSFGDLKADLPEQCLSCEWLKYCRGGCPKERLMGKLNYFCAGLQNFFQHADRGFQLLARRWQYRQQMIEAAERREAQPGRNSLCPCGSGLKYKKCCGK